MRQVNYQVSFNPKSRSHVALMEWLESQTVNRSSFIRETLSMRMMGMFGYRSIEVQEEAVEEINREDALRLIEV